jgi:hypothetical protein
MTDTIGAVRDLFVLIPVTIRRVIYGLLGLTIILDGALHILPDPVEDVLVTVFGLFAAVMALANTTPPTPPPLEPLRVKPDEFA